MRHRKGFNHLGRTRSHRKAMMANMASSLILHKRIKTTTAKAKALRSYVEPLITKSKEDSTHSRRVVFSHLKDKFAVSELFREISPKVADRQGGYTRILKTGNRLGDNADMCIIELVDYNVNLLEAQETTKAKPSRRRRGKKKAASDNTQTKVLQTEESAVNEEKVSDTTISAESQEEKRGVESQAVDGKSEDKTKPVEKVKDVEEPKVEKKESEKEQPEEGEKPE